MLNVDSLLTARQVAHLTGHSVTTLRDSRFRERQRLPVVKLGRRVVRFRVDDVQGWIRRNTSPSKETTTQYDQQHRSADVPHV